MDVALAVSVLEIGFQGGKGKDPLLSFFMNTRISAFRASDGRQLQDDIFKYASPQRRFSEWSENGSLALREALQAGYDQTAEAAIEKYFLLYEVKMDSIWSGEQHCMLKPLDPPQRSLEFFSTQLNFAELTSLPPTLKWEPFPRDKDIETDSKGVLNKIKDITYELKVWRGNDWTPRELIYHRSGIAVPEHLVDTAMQSGIEYYWAVRAHFKLDGQERLTRWSYSRIPWSGPEDPCRENIIPLNHYHRFKMILQ